MIAPAPPVPPVPPVVPMLPGLLDFEMPDFPEMPDLPMPETAGPVRTCPMLVGPCRRASEIGPIGFGP